MYQGSLYLHCPRARSLSIIPIRVYRKRRADNRQTFVVRVLVCFDTSRDLIEKSLLCQGLLGLATPVWGCFLLGFLDSSIIWPLVHRGWDPILEDTHRRPFTVSGCALVGKILLQVERLYQIVFLSFCQLSLLAVPIECMCRILCLLASCRGPRLGR